MFGLGLWELIVVLAIILLLFGAKRLPDLAKTLGKSAQILRKNMQDGGKKTKKDE
jgi:sec-independent protein translocase protein TatA